MDLQWFSNVFNSLRPEQNGSDNFIFQMHFCDEICCILVHLSLKFGPEGPSIGLGDGLALNRLQAIVWPNNDPVCQHISMVKCKTAVTPVC